MPPPPSHRPHDDGDGDDDAVTFGLIGIGGQPRGGGGGAAAGLLQCLDASCQQLTSLPPAVRAGGGGERVRELTLAFNSLSCLDGLPQACPCLERLNASHNRL